MVVVDVRDERVRILMPFTRPRLTPQQTLTLLKQGFNEMTTVGLHSRMFAVTSTYSSETLMLHRDISAK